MFLLLDDHGTPLGEFETRREAEETLTELVRADPSATFDCFIAEFDEHGQRI
jgi:hypothetical protein